MKTDIISLVFSSVVFAAMLTANAFAVNSIAARYDCTEVNLKDAAVSPQQINAMLDKNENDFSLWNNTGAVEITGTLHSAPYSVEKYIVYGNAYDVFAPSEKYGGELTCDDKSGCIISESAAYALYNSADVIGSSVILGEKKYFIRGVYHVDNPMIIISSDDKYMQFEHIEISGRLINDDIIIAAAGSPDNSFIIRGTDHSEILSFLAQIPIFLLCVFIIAVSLRYRSSFGFHSIPSFVAIAVSSIFIIIILSSVPTVFIPSKWSDLEFYSEVCADISDYLKSYLCAENDCKAYTLLLLTAKSFILTLCEIAAVAFGIIPQCLSLLKKAQAAT